ncbi:transcription elongation factor [Angomonas deanei]|uniref:TFIIS-type domain-containing protein n=1 Tax=Angomonas deanei TaxID=59799 RepID=A0A7G2CKN3_9TRYP|nr:transcription elongation factor [Angomonas deanei]CAD2219969.1 hypothetical protein, conserved [Angomonas deanei]|eukprot:EPY22275.1 transcription elongation factor [Angomonas deanei]
MLIGKALSDPLNHSLRENLWTGKLSEEELVKMNEFELLNPVDRSALEEERKARLEQKTVAFIEELASVKTELYPCPQCGNKECYANFRSTDFVKWHGDDPTPTILKCKKCGHHFRM